MRTTGQRLAGPQRRLVIGVCIAAGAAYMQPATYNYIVTPILVTFDAGNSAAAGLREAPSVASLLVIFLTAVLAERFGARRVVSVGAVVLVLGSLVVAVAPLLTVAIAGLALQAVGATVLLVVPLATIAASLRDPGTRASGFAIFSMVSPLVFVALPVLTALLMERYSWRVVAFTWAVGGGVALLAGRWALSADPGNRGSHELLTPALAGVLCVGLVQLASHIELSMLTAVRAAITVTAALGLFVALRRAHRPSLNTAILHGRGMLLVLTVVALWCFTQLWYYMTLAYEYVFGLSVLITAALMVPAQASAAIGAHVAGRLVRRRGITATGCGLLMVTGAAMALSTVLGLDSPLWWPVLVTSLYSFAAVAAGVPITNAVMDGADAGDEAGASAYRQAAISVGTAVGIALTSALVMATFTSSLTTQLQTQGLDNATANQIAVDLRSGVGLQQESVTYAVGIDEVQDIDDAQKQAYLAAIDTQGWTGAVASVLTAGLFWVGRRRTDQQPHPASVVGAVRPPS